MGGSEVTWPRHTVGHHQIQHLQPIGHYPAPFQPISHHPHLAAGPPVLYEQDIPACHTPMADERKIPKAKYTKHYLGGPAKGARHRPQRQAFQSISFDMERRLVNRELAARCEYLHLSGPHPR